KIFEYNKNIPTIRFDKIDTCIIGIIAQSITDKKYDVSISGQTLCITHLHQVAAMSDQHLLNKKEETKKRTTTKISELTLENKINQLSEMMTGTEMTDSAMNHSKELINLSDKYKQLNN